MIGEIGTISHGTLRTEDLLQAFADELKLLDMANEYESLLRKCNRIIKKGDYDSEEAVYLVNESLPDALNSFAPDDCYFGSHPGDGSDFGFWEYDVDRA
jgi:hypothetical protein